MRVLVLGSRHLIEHDSWRDIEEASPSCYRLTENIALESIEIIGIWESTYRDTYISIITNLIGSICSPRLRSVSVNLRSMVEEVEHFPWGVVNGLAKVSPYVLQRVGIALHLRIEEHPDGSTYIPLAPGGYDGYFRQVRSALPEIDKIVITSIAVRHSSLISHLVDSPNAGYI